MAMSLCSMGVSAENWGLYHAQGAPTSAYRTTQTIYVLPEYTGKIGGYCSSYSLSSGDISVDATLYVPNESTGYLDACVLDVPAITKKGGCDIRDQRIYDMTVCKITVSFSDSNTYGSAYGRYK